MNRGFTLIEAAISILILALLATPVLYFYNSNIATWRAEATYKKANDAVRALHNYRIANGFYPCPAPLVGISGVNNPVYGIPLETACSSAVPAAGSCEGGVCASNAIASRSAQIADPRVVIGALPFRELQIDEEDSYDGYGGRLVYAVTSSMTDRDTIDEAAGAIAVRDGDGATGNSLSDIDGSITLVVLSHGPNKMGAYNINGLLMAPCDGSDIEEENCNHTASEAIFRSDLEGLAFDDTIIYFSSNKEPLWQRSTDDLENISDLSPDGISMGGLEAQSTLDIATPSTGFGGRDSLHVRGQWPDSGTNNIDGTEGVIYLNNLDCDADGDADPNTCNEYGEICDINGTFCLSPEQLRSDSPLWQNSRMQCPAGRYVYAIAGTGTSPRVLCTNSLRIECETIDNDIDEDGVYEPILNGIDGDGNPICVALPLSDCDPTVFNHEIYTCGQDYPLPGRNDSFIYPPLSDPKYQRSDCGYARFVCNNGAWEINHPSLEGSCEDLPDDPPGSSCAASCESQGYVDNGNGDGNICQSQTYICCPNDTHGALCDANRVPPDAPAWHTLLVLNGNGDDVPDPDFSQCDCPSGDEPVSEECSVVYNNTTLAGTATAIRTFLPGTPPDCPSAIGAYDSSDCLCPVRTTDYDSVPYTSCYNFAAGDGPGRVDDGTGDAPDTSCNDNNPNTHFRRKTFSGRDCPSGKVIPPGGKGAIEVRRFNPEWTAPGLAGQCKWSGWDEVYNDCICSEDPITSFRPTICDDQICFRPDPTPTPAPRPTGPDEDRRTTFGQDLTVSLAQPPNSDGTCADRLNYEVVPNNDSAYTAWNNVERGQCIRRTFTWQKDSSTNQPNPSGQPVDAIIVGRECTCNDHQDTALAGVKVSCYEGELDIIDKCYCEESN